VPSPPPVPPGAISAGLIKWARAVARGVRADYRFRRGSQEEWDIESAAFEELTRAAGRWRPEEAGVEPDATPATRPGAFIGFAAKAVRSACRREARRLRSCGMVSERGHRLGAAAGPVRSLADLRTPDGDPWEPADHRGDDDDPPPPPPAPDAAERAAAYRRWVLAAAWWNPAADRWEPPDERTAAVVHRWMVCGWPLWQAAAEFGVSEEAARRAVRRAGLGYPPGA
jgi:hypothetical protein